MLRQIEDAERQVWGKQSRTFEDVTHVLGGLGLGLLAYSAFGGRTRPIGFTLIGLSTLFHLYAYLTAQSTETTGVTESDERLAA